MTSTPIIVDKHGYVKFIEAWGTGEAGQCDRLMAADARDYECGIIEAARQSTQASFRGWDQDQKLLEYLFSSKPKHAGPFEFAGMTIEVQAPIFVFREWHRHRTQSYNEMSARYAPLPDLYYTPVLEDVMTRAHADTKNRQAKGLPGTDLTEKNAQLWLESLDHFYTNAENLYQWALKIGIPKELARVSMPVGHYTRMRASGNLRNWLAFLTLRMDPNAQAEIRRYAHAVGLFVTHYFPRTWSQFRLEQDSK
jgi:thymidylate synthase (FAD)